MEEEATIESQYYAFAKLTDHKRNGETITLYNSDYWLRQANVLDDRNVTMVDTGLCFLKHSKTELTFTEWSEMLTELCATKQLDENNVRIRLTVCGLPGEIHVEVPKYRSYFKDYVPKNKLLDI